MKLEPSKNVAKIDMVFGKIDGLLPPMAEIPEEFDGGSGKWNKVVSRWFFKGLPKETEFYPKDGIDAGEALRHVAAIMRSFEPKHEHKEAGCAYLLSLWFDDIIIPKGE